MKTSDILGEDDVSLEQMLFCREQRMLKQRQCIEIFNTPVVCITINTAGPYKSFPLVVHTYREGCRLTEECFKQFGARYELFSTSTDHCGPCAIYSVDYDIKKLKLALCAIEDATGIGRLLDIDLLNEDGVKISRGEVGLDSRKCLICGEHAAACARSRRHSVERLQEETIDRIIGYFAERYADILASCAAKALLYEVSVTPKPGLVDHHNNGAHDDMDFFTFINSTAALIPFFRKLCLVGCLGYGKTNAELFDIARKIGIDADSAMFAATGGINTHKGIVFSIGLLCVAAGSLYIEKLCLQSGVATTPSAEDIAKRCAELARCALTDFDRIVFVPVSNGDHVFVKYQAGGVRQEAANGFPSVIDIVLPALNSESNVALAGKSALLALFVVIEDTNVLHRGGPTLLNV